MDSYGWPMIQYKVSLTDSMWNPKESLAIQLWKSIDQGHPKRIPKPIPFYPIWKNDASKSKEKENFINS